MDFDSILLSFKKKKKNRRLEIFKRMLLVLVTKMKIITYNQTTESYW